MRQKFLPLGSEADCSLAVSSTESVVWVTNASRSGSTSSTTPRKPTGTSPRKKLAVTNSMSSRQIGVLSVKRQRWP